MGLLDIEFEGAGQGRSERRMAKATPAAAFALTALAVLALLLAGPQGGQARRPQPTGAAPGEEPLRRLSGSNGLALPTEHGPSLSAQTPSPYPQVPADHDVEGLEEPAPHATATEHHAQGPTPAPQTVASEAAAAAEAAAEAAEAAHWQVTKEPLAGSPVPVPAPVAVIPTQEPGEHYSPVRQEPPALPAEHSEQHSPAAHGEAGVHENADGEHHEASGEGHHEHEVHSFVALFFLFGGFGGGCLIQVIQERYLQAIPYTCLLFITGFLLSLLHHYRPREHWSYWQTWYNSIEMWEHIDPHVVLYVFLPALVFSEAMRLNIKLGKRLLAQVLLLACPGVIAGTCLTAAFVHYVFPYGWDWPVSLVFGSILAATDPVAVVALFNTLGVSPRLTMLISGESLLNDGTAIVLFNLMMELWKGKDISAWYATTFFLHMTVVSFFLGVAVGVLGLIVIFATAETRFHSDAMIQVAVTVCVGYLCFFWAEKELQTSGVLTVVTGGVVFSYLAWPRFISKETMKTVWEFIEFLGNTIIFLLAGLLFGANAFSRKAEEHLHISDIGWLLLLYVAATFIRFIMIGSLWPLLNCCGERITWQEVIVMTWSGLRGAVGLVLAISVDRGITSVAKQENEVGSRFMFHVGGVAMLTILVNATLAAPLLAKLGFTKTEEVEEKCIEHFERITDNTAQIALRQALESGDPDPRFAGASPEFTMDFVPALSHGPPERESTNKLTGAKLRQFREIFMRAVQHLYWKDIDSGLLPRTGRVARVLLYSCDSALDDPRKRLKDWHKIEEAFEDHAVIPCLNKLSQIWPLSMFAILSEEFFPSEATVMIWQVYAALTFIEAHKEAEKNLPRYFGPDGILGYEVQMAVLDESRAQCALAATTLQGLPTDVIEAVKSRMLAGKLLQLQLDKVTEFEDSGLLSEKGASHISHRLLDAQRVVSQKSTFDLDDNYMPEDTGDSSSDEDDSAPSSAVRRELLRGQ